MPPKALVTTPLTAATILSRSGNTSIYILASLPLINIVSREATPLSFSKRIIIYAINAGETHTLNFSKV